jgi:hypothetical protein
MKLGSISRQMSATCFRRIRNDSEHFLKLLADRKNISPDEIEKWRTNGERLAADQLRFRTYFANLPEKFEQALAFKQLKSTR